MLCCKCCECYEATAVLMSHCEAILIIVSHHMASKSHYEAIIVLILHCEETPILMLHHKASLIMMSYLETNITLMQLLHVNCNCIKVENINFNFNFVFKNIAP